MDERRSRFTHSTNGERLPIEQVRAEIVRWARAEAAERLKATDWYVTRAIDTDGAKPAPSYVREYREKVRAMSDVIVAEAATVNFDDQGSKALWALFDAIERSWPRSP